MTHNHTIPDRGTLKTQAKRLRKSLEGEGNFITHSEALELIAHQHGMKDWNTLSAAAPLNAPKQNTRLAVGETISGHYLGHPVTGKIISLASLNNGSHFRLALHLDTPVNVIKFEGIKALRRRINATITKAGKTIEKTSDGQPHLVLAL